MTNILNTGEAQACLSPWPAVSSPPTNKLTLARAMLAGNVGGRAIEPFAYVESVTITAPGTGFATAPAIVIAPVGSFTADSVIREAEAEAEIASGGITAVNVTEGGYIRTMLTGCTGSRRRPAAAAAPARFWP